VQDAIEERMAELLRQARAKAGVDADDLGFVPRFVASTVLALMAWALEHQIAPSPAVLQAQFQRLVEPACA